MNYEETTKKLISEKAGVEEETITHDSHFEDDLNLGEIEIIEIFGEVEEKFQVDLTEEKKNIETVGDLVAALNEKLE